MKWYQMAARQGYVEAQYKFGKLCTLFSDKTLLIYWLNKVANGGSQEAVALLEELGYKVGEGYDEALAKLRKLGYDIGR